MPLTKDEWEEFDRTRIRLATEEILASENGRFFLLMLMDTFGANTTPFDPDPHFSAFRAGRHSCAKDLEAILLTHNPYSIAALMQASADEAQQRKTANAE